MKGKSLQGDESAAGLALDILLWIAGDADRLMPFLAGSGMDLDTLRAGTHDRAVLAGVLDHVMGDEPVLLACARALAVEPERIAAAWRRLSPQPDPD